MYIIQLELTNHDCFCRQDGLSDGMVIFTPYYPESSASYVYQLLQWLAVVMGQQWCIFHWITHSYSRGQSVKISNCKIEKKTILKKLRSQAWTESSCLILLRSFFNCFFFIKYLSSYLKGQLIGKLQLYSPPVHAKWAFIGNINSQLWMVEKQVRLTKSI